jgi:hypothetical protein
VLIETASSTIADTTSTSASITPGLSEWDELATWQVDPDYDRPGPDATEIHVLVTERACASGEDPGDRLHEPIVVEGADEVVATFYVESIFKTQTTATCPGNPAVPYVVSLGAPLGDRDLIDGGDSPAASRLARLPLPTHGLSRQDLADTEQAAVLYTGALVGTVGLDAATGCAYIDTDAGRRTVWWPGESEAMFADTPGLLLYGQRIASEGDTIAVIGGRASAEQVPDRCVASDFVWIGVDVVTSAPDPPPRDPKVTDACYQPFAFSYNGFTITMDSAIWCTLVAGDAMVETPDGRLIQGPLDWIADTRTADLVLLDPATGELLIAVPAEVYSAAVSEHHNTVVLGG